MSHQVSFSIQNKPPSTRLSFRSKISIYLFKVNSASDFLEKKIETFKDL